MTAHEFVPFGVDALLADYFEIHLHKKRWLKS